MATLPLRSATPDSWAELAARELPVFLADHAVCEQQAALSALNLVSHYPEDAELVDRMSSLAAEEVMHLRRVAAILHRRNLQPSRRRSNPYARSLRENITAVGEPQLKSERLMVGALIEARSCERFTRLLDVLDGRDPEIGDLLFDLGPAEKRHWELFHRLAAREVEASWLEPRWEAWLRFEGALMERAGIEPRVHG